MSVKIVMFLHTYARDGEFGTFMKGLIKGMQNSGFQLHIFKVNDLVGALKNKNYLNPSTEEFVKQKLDTIEPDLIFTTNWAGISQKIIKEYSHIPRVTWMVDRNPFTHHGKKISDAFTEDDIVITSSSSNVARLERLYPVLQGNVHYLPFMTETEAFNHDTPKDINISFIGSLFANSEAIKRLLDTYQDKEFRENIFKYVKAVEENYELNIKDTLEKYNLYKKISKMMEIESFHGIVANLISNNKRIKYLDSIADLGLVFYGTPNWTKVLDYSTELFSHFQYETFVKTRQELCNIYDRSKIALNINHHQATTGQGYRVFDILASSALLITNYQKNSDLEKLFGKDHPIPIYRNETELRELCRYYLEHEDERQALVKQCNALIGDKHTFKARAKEIVKLALPQWEFSGVEKIYEPEFISVPMAPGSSPLAKSKKVVKTVLRIPYRAIKRII